MSVLSEVEILDLVKRAKEFDYVHFCLPDLNGISRGKTVVGRYAETAIRNGLGIFPGKCPFETVESQQSHSKVIKPHLKVMISDNFDFI